jgi:transcriptional regulator with XRE-family HTH domain
MLKELATVARLTREAAGLSQIDIATSAQVTAATISRFENGKRHPREIERIIKAYAVECGVSETQLWQRATKRLG